jgi:hypothetical protein
MHGAVDGEDCIAHLPKEKERRATCFNFRFLADNTSDHETNNFGIRLSSLHSQQDWVPQVQAKSPMIPSYGKVIFCSVLNKIQ